MKRYILAQIALIVIVLGAFYGFSTSLQKGTVNKPANAVSTAPSKSAKTSVVYMTKEINSAALMDIYKALDRKVNGKVAVKISTGEPGGTTIYLLI